MRPPSIEKELLSRDSESPVKVSGKLKKEGLRVLIDLVIVIVTNRPIPQPRRVSEGEES